MKPLAPALLMAALMFAPLTAPAASAELEFERFLDWFEGEFDNYEQVWQQKLNGDQTVAKHTHHIFRAVELPWLGAQVFFVQRYLDGDRDQVNRQQLYSFDINEAENAIQMTIYSFPDDVRFRHAHQDPTLLSALEQDQVRKIPGCTMFWKWNGEFFDGHMKKDACTFISERTQQRVYINDSLRLMENWLQVRHQARDERGAALVSHDIPHKNRKVIFYKGWMSVKKHKLDPEADLGEWVFAKIDRMHSEGQRIPLLDKTGQGTGYTLSLETLTYQNTQIPVLKIGVIDDRTGYTLSYSWTNPGAERIGMNVRWFQAGLTRIDE